MKENTSNIIDKIGFICKTALYKGMKNKCQKKNGDGTRFTTGNLISYILKKDVYINQNILL